MFSCEAAARADHGQIPHIAIIAAAPPSHDENHLSGHLYKPCCSSGATHTPLLLIRRQDTAVLVALACLAGAGRLDEHALKDG
mmetsp:Transcript_1557/g.4174  ORF Transcript_1557/g.4174 Transcript_1557/m.4174 type:complete len:83 (+) Transcript_1557:675-923(+)